MTIDLTHPHMVQVTIAPASPGVEGSLLSLVMDGHSRPVVGDLIWPNTPAGDQR
ncbi:hypothetical protein IF650_19540 [Cellulosimicrobium terreum]|nr:hypothetical protein [Cellulosimicrobium terreum]